MTTVRVKIEKVGSLEVKGFEGQELYGFIKNAILSIGDPNIQVAHIKRGPRPKVKSEEAPTGN